MSSGGFCCSVSLVIHIAFNDWNELKCFSGWHQTNNPLEAKAKINTKMKKRRRWGKRQKKKKKEKKRKKKNEKKGTTPPTPSFLARLKAKCSSRPQCTISSSPPLTKPRMAPRSNQFTDQVFTNQNFLKKELCWECFKLQVFVVFNHVNLINYIGSQGFYTCTRMGQRHLRNMSVVSVSLIGLIKLLKKELCWEYFKLVLTTFNYNNLINWVWS